MLEELGKQFYTRVAMEMYVSLNTVAKTKIILKTRFSVHNVTKGLLHHSNFNATFTNCEKSKYAHLPNTESHIT